MDDMESRSGVAGEETKCAEGQQATAEASKACEAGKGDAQMSIGVTMFPMSLVEAMAKKEKHHAPAHSAEEEAEQLLVAYANYVRSHTFEPGQLIVPKRLGNEKAYAGVFGVVLDPQATPGPEDAPYETLRIGRFREGHFRGDMFYDPLLFQPYVPSVTVPGGEETGAQ